MVLTKELSQKISEQLREPKAMADLRLAAAEDFAQREMPTFRYGQGILVKPAELDLGKFKNVSAQPLSLKEQPGIKLRKLEAADLNYLFSTVKFDENYFISLQKAWFNRAAVIEVEADARVDNLVIDFDLTQKWHIDYLLVLAHTGSQVEVIEKQTSQSLEFRSSLVEVIIKENAKVNYSLVQSLDRRVTAFDTRQATVEKDGQINWRYILLGGDFHKLEIGSTLAEKGANSSSNGLVFGKAQQKFSINNTTQHNSAHTQSHMNLRGVAAEQSNLFAWGSIDIAPQAQHSSADEKIDMLVMSEKAQANAIPDLFVATNDVQCSHGATISQLDSEKVFYLQSRGINDSDATKLLVNGFVEPVVKNFESNESLKATIDNRINDLV